MTDALKALILELVPADGSTIGNQSLLAAIQKRMPKATESGYRDARDALLEEGILGKGRGRGGSVFRIDGDDSVDQDDAETEPDDDDVGMDDDSEDESDDEDIAEGDGEVFTLTHTVESVTTRRRGAAGGKTKKRTKPADGAQVVSYRHLDKRVNNPEVGMVHPENDPDKPKTVWAYDPHIDPALQFSLGRTAIEQVIDAAIANRQSERSLAEVLETLIEDALAAGKADKDILAALVRRAIEADRSVHNTDRMHDALVELKRMQEPYLNWAGKAERTSFEVDTVSLHVHERIDPASILAAVRKRLKGKAETTERPTQLGLFEAPFESLPLRQALDFYRHEKNWSNRLIAGDSLLVMNSLIHKESMAGQVQMIYIDPPYGIKYGSNFQPFVGKRKLADSDKDEDLNQEPEMLKAFRDTWELGLHSYLTYLRDRLLLARELLHESGSVFVQISDENVHYVRGLLDETFGGQNFISQIAFSKTGSVSGNYLGKVCDIILFYAKDKQHLKYRTLYEKKASVEDSYSEDPLKSDGFRSTTTFDHDFMGKKWSCGQNEHWKVTEAGLRRAEKAGRIIPKTSSLRLRKYFSDFEYRVFHSVWLGFGGAANMQYVVETNAKIIERCVLMTTDPGDLVLDPTCGSGTTAFVAEKWGRRWITCDTSRVAITLAKQRLMTASFDYYALRYPHEGLKGGFIYKTVPHVTLESIANNPEIDEIYDRLHPAIEAALAALNAALTAAPPFTPTQGVRKGKKVTFAKGEALHEWEVPFDWPEAWPGTARSAFDTFHAARQAMQRAMDASIAAHAEPETLYDKPDPDLNKLRITGPFSVEAVPNPTVLALDEARPADEANVAVARSGETSRQAQWRDELMKTGIRGKGGQMLKFAEMEPLPGLRHLHASGTFAETGERVVISFGPEHAALEQRQVALALSEAEKLRPAPKFIVFCSFTFDPEAAKDIDEVNWPGVTLLKAQMNTDLLTEDLKKARSSNQSFWLMGQPDVEVRKRQDGLWEVEVHGFDYFDPKAGELVSGGKSKIAMWSLDTDYDQRSLFPHQVFFPIAGKKAGWNRLKKTIRAELDEELLEQFHGTVSLPFAAGDNRCVAVKIVDDRGIESLKIVALDD